MTDWKMIVALVGSIVLGSGGQLALKAGALAVTARGGGPMAYVQPMLGLGIGLYAAAAILYVVALTRIPLVIAFPSVALSYVAVSYISHRLWNEPFGPAQMAGLALILTGVVLIAWRVGEPAAV